MREEEKKAELTAWAAVRATDETAERNMMVDWEKEGFVGVDEQNLNGLERICVPSIGVTPDRDETSFTCQQY